jgi:hypothetical protein
MSYLFVTNHWVLIIVSFEAKTIKIIDPIRPNYETKVSRVTPENLKFCVGFAKNLLNEIKRSIINSK